MLLGHREELDETQLHTGTQQQEGGPGPPSLLSQEPSGNGSLPIGNCNRDLKTEVSMEENVLRLEDRLLQGNQRMSELTRDNGAQGFLYI